MLRWRRLAVCFIRLTADLMSGINSFTSVIDLVYTISFQL